MKNKLLKIIVILIILFSMLYVQITTVKGINFGSAFKNSIIRECPTVPGSSKDPEVPTVPINTNISTDSVEHHNVTRYIRIEGNVKEDLGMGETTGAAGIRVKLLKKDRNKSEQKLFKKK